ncbi:MSCRAMM family protein [Lapidilactobacillus dextrinicus]|uniref:MSCRAMM family protein n=1 Tax=Lapidilactobacillus dextrinicus TaxID=51664 RepID=UPI0022E93446|nr:SpaA isopeptide-forming pilin-related protein [Lapidilactobacillus dextrinicus]
MQRSFGQNAADFLGWFKRRFYGRRSLLLFLVFLVPFLNALMSPPQEVSAADSAGKLIISPDTISRPEVTTTGQTTETYIPWSGKTENLNRWDDWITNKSTYSLFKAGAGMTGVAFNGVSKNNGTESSSGNSIPGTITLDYANVGLYNFSTSDNPNLQSIGAKITISNIIYGSQPSWGGNTYPYIMFSDNLYSGVVYGRIKKMQMQISFYRTSDKQPIVFTEDSNSVFGFNSLNGNGATSHAEFAGSGSQNGQVSPNTLMRYTSGGISNASYTQGTYYGTSDDFTDHLGGDTFPDAAVSFPLNGTTNTFTFGSVYGRAWNSFSSATVYPTAQQRPTKTVEPLKQYQAGDTWNNPTGAETGFAQRYDNDLDRYNDGTGPWDYWNAQAGHDASGNLGLNAGIPKLGDRYVETDKEYYYYINQPTINLATSGLILPTGYTITDTLPAGTQYESATLYNLDGTQLQTFGAEAADGQNLTFNLSNDSTTAINNLSKDSGYFGKDFTIRIKFKVSNTTTDDINDLMENEAHSTFHYVNNVNYDADSNKVHIKVKDNVVKLDFIKQDEQGNPLAGAVFELLDKDDNKIGEQVTSDQDGHFTFTADKIPDGSYTLTEITPPNGYEKVTDIKVTVNDGKVIATDPKLGTAADGTPIVKDKKTTYKLQLTKTNGKDPLKDAVFVMTDANGKQLPDAKEIISDANGLVAFPDSLDPSGSYYFKEVKAPSGYVLSDVIYKLTFQDGKAYLTNAKTGAAISNDSVSNDKIANFTITNEFKDLSLRIKKIDSETNELLAGAEFTLTGPDDKTTQVVTSKNVDGQDWNIEFKNLKPGTYKLKETKAPDGYELDNTEHKVVIAQDGSVTYDDKKLDQITNDANTIIVGTPEIGNSPQKVMPHTGGSGIGSFMMIASVLLGLATILLVTTYVKRQEVRDHD